MTTLTPLTISPHQDDYVLTRLFKKSGVHSAVRHDVIEGHGTPDGAILEAEATKVKTPRASGATPDGASEVADSQLISLNVFSCMATRNIAISVVGPCFALALTCV